MEFIIDKLRTKLANWKTKFLSLAGRLVLVRSTLASIPTYAMQTNFLPVSTLNSIDTMCNNFLWGNNEDHQKEHRKIHLLSKDKTFLPKEKGGLGIPRAINLNLAFMAKLGWKLCQGNPNIARKCIKAKYIHHSYITPFKIGSPIWKSIGKAWHILTKNPKWIIKNGRSASFWNDNWLGIGPLRSFIQGPLQAHENSQTISSFISNSSWNLGLLSFSLPDHLLKKISSFPIPSSTEDDHPIPQYLHLDNFITNQAYRTQFEHKISYNLDHIWKANTSPKIRTFLWLVWWDRLPHKLTLSQRNIITDTNCTICGHHTENAFHILWACPQAQAIWKFFPLCLNPPSSNLHDWLWQNLKSSAITYDLQWNSLFPSLCFEVWKQRNAHIFSSQNLEPPETIKARAINQTRDFLRATSNNINICTIKPKPWEGFSSHLFFHVDASFIDAHHPTGIGGCLRDNKGTWILGFQFYCFATNVTHAEIIAIQQALLIAQSKGINNLYLCSDNRKALHIINAQNTIYDMCANDVLKCRELARGMPTITLSHVPRRNNSVADALSKDCRKRSHELLPCIIYYLNHPPP
ncbi:hypothetical protein RDABS01_019518 [Bienertia sinuspersici]